MSSAVALMRWENVAEFQATKPLRYSCRQERLQKLNPGNSLWLVSRCPDDQQYYFVAVLRVTTTVENPPNSALREHFGPFSVIANPTQSYLFVKSFPADAVLRALIFDTRNPVKFGAQLGHTFQTIRFVSEADETLLDAALEKSLANAGVFTDRPFGLWTKCAPEFADYFLANWQANQKPLAFLLYDSAPAIQVGAPVFVHADKNLALMGRFVGAQVVSAYRHTSDKEETVQELERVWALHRLPTLNPPTTADFDEFWRAQDGVRSLFLFENICPASHPIPYKVYGRALEWGFPNGVGYRYLTFSESMMLVKAFSSELHIYADFSALFCRRQTRVLNV